MVVLFNSKYKQSTYELGNSKNVEFLEYSFLTADDEAIKLIKETKAFKNGEIWVEDEYENMEAAAEKKKNKGTKRTKIVTGARGTDNT